MTLTILLTELVRPFARGLRRAGHRGRSRTADRSAAPPAFRRRRRFVQALAMWDSNRGRLRSALRSPDMRFVGWQFVHDARQARRCRRPSARADKPPQTAFFLAAPTAGPRFAA